MHYERKFRVAPGSKLRLKDIDPDYKGHFDTELDATADLELYRRYMARMQSLLYAERKHSILVVLQAMDAGGKDGTISHVFGGLNPQGTTVTSFKQPTPEELAHDFLWRVHPHAPRQGEVAIFNRSHYEDVLTTRVHGQIDKKTWRARCKHIRHFEKLLTEQGTSVLKFYLHISKEEQLRRFGERLDDPGRNWKISESDYTERRHWNDYMRAFEDVLGETSTKEAPWFVIPANHKWFRNLAVSQIIAHAMERLRMSYPEPAVDLADIRHRYHRAAQEEEREEKKPA